MSRAGTSVKACEQMRRKVNGPFRHGAFARGCDRLVRVSVKRVILDTDIGTDVDDCLALSLGLCSPELRLVGVTCVYGDVSLRARMAHALLALYGSNSGVPVRRGARNPLLGLRPVYWAGHEGAGLVESMESAEPPEPSGDDEPAAAFIVRTVMDNPGEIHLVAIGPLTNIAIAFLNEPRLAENLGHLTIMGGAIRGSDALHLPYAEHNVRSDPEAAHVVMSSGTPITLIPLDVTTLVRIDQSGVDRVRSGGTPFHEAVARQVELYPRFARQGHTFLHDPLAMATLIRPELVETVSMHVDVELTGQHTGGATLARTPTDDTPANASVALRVDASAFEEFLVNRLATAGSR